MNVDHVDALRQFRYDVYKCFQRSRDTLFNTGDALMTETQAKSFFEVSQSLWFERKWPSLNEAFEDRRIDEKRLREIFAHYPPKPDTGKRLWIGIDASSIARPSAVTSADRTVQHVHNLPECKKPITFGWQFSTVVALPETPSSWTYILDQQRSASSGLAKSAAPWPSDCCLSGRVCCTWPAMPWIRRSNSSSVCAMPRLTTCWRPLKIY
jgi:DDE superfamily endonuclease